MDGSLLQINFDLNEIRTKRAAVAYDLYDGLKPFIYLYKAGALRIRLNLEDWTSLMSIKSEVESFFMQELLQSQSFTLRDNLFVSFTEAYNKRLIMIENSEWPVSTSSKPRAPIRLWLSSKQWLALLRSQPCIEAMYQRMHMCSDEIRLQYDTLISYLNQKIGEEVRTKFGDVKIVEKAVHDIDLASLCVTSTHGLDTIRVLLELCNFHESHIARSLQYLK